MRRQPRVLLLGVALQAAALSAYGAGEDRFFGGSRDGFEVARSLVIPAAVRAAWYFGGPGDGSGAARFSQVADDQTRGWYRGGGGDGFHRAERFADSAMRRGDWFRGGPRDGTDRAAALGWPNPLDRDSDVDGLPDWWELDAGHTLLGVVPMEDLDDDEFSNLHEYLAGTSGTDSGSLLKVEQMEWAETYPVITWQSAAGRSYVLERATNLNAGTWFTVATNLAAVLPMNTRTDATVTGGGPWHYRIRLE